MKRACVKLAALLSTDFPYQVNGDDTAAALTATVLVGGLKSGNATVIAEAEAGLKALVPDDISVDIEDGAFTCTSKVYKRGFGLLFEPLLNFKTLTLGVLNGLNLLLGIVKGGRGIGEKVRDGACTLRVTRQTPTFDPPSTVEPC